MSEARRRARDLVWGAASAAIPGNPIVPESVWELSPCSVEYFRDWVHAAKSRCGHVVPGMPRVSLVLDSIECFACAARRAGMCSRCKRPLTPDMLIVVACASFADTVVVASLCPSCQALSEYVIDPIEQE